MSFALVTDDTIQRIGPAPKSARRLDNAIGSGFGIFGGKSNQLARLRFNADAARWVSLADVAPCSLMSGGGSSTT